MQYLYTAIAICLMTMINAQTYKLEILITDADTKEPLIGANALIEELNKGASSNLEGRIQFIDLEADTYQIRVTYVGYETMEKTIVVPNENGVSFELEEDGEQLEGITVTTTRSTRLIQDLPTRVEVITAEELGEKNRMNPTNISVLLRESTGIQMQQTSANSANQSLRIQGLDGRYTQLLKDGFPLFGGFSSGLSIMQIPPLDLKQVELIKGSASTLYGGGAIAGIVNLVSRTPEHEPVLDFMFSQTQAVGSTLNAFYAQEYGKLGLSLFTSLHNQKAFDNNDDNFSDLPSTKSLSINPTLFYEFSEDTRLRCGVKSFLENRVGGDLSGIVDPKADRFTEINLSQRFAIQLAFEHDFSENAQLILKNSVNYFDRSIQLPDYKFEGAQIASYSEAALSLKDNWIFGLNIWTDVFEEFPGISSLIHNYEQITFGAFIQNNTELSPKLTLESGLRTDYALEYGAFVLPRISLLYDISQHWTTRIGGGLGYKLPTIFTEETEALAYRGILPINEEATKAETSIGGNLDLNYKGSIGDKIGVTINNLLFYTRLNDPLILVQTPTTGLGFVNSPGFADSKGLETNVKFSYEDWRLFLSYALIDAKIRSGEEVFQKPLTPKHSTGTVLMYEGKKWRVGYELYYRGSQFLTDREQVQDYWMMGLLVMRNFEKFSAYVNFENFTDTRQSQFQPMFTGSVNNPDFAEIWAPTDGFIFSIGMSWYVFGREEHGHHD